MSTAVHRSPNKLRRFYTIVNLCPEPIYISSWVKWREGLFAGFGLFVTVKKINDMKGKGDEGRMVDHPSRCSGIKDDITPLSRTHY